MAQQIGQYRYQSSGQCMTYITNYTTSLMSLSDTSEESADFKDLVIGYDGGFNQSTDYYLKVAIPQDLNYQYTFDIKLMNASDGTDVYQFLKKQTIPRGGTANNLYHVGLYETESGEVRSMIPLTYVAGQNVYVQDLLYWNSESDIFYLGNGTSTPTVTTNVNDIDIPASWRSESTTKKKEIEMIFRPVAEDFNRIVFDMTRTAEDYSIQRTVNGVTEYGKVVDISGVEVTLASLTNLVPNMNPNDDGTLSHIGIWGHQNLLMAVNGEQIQIGPSGLYELDNILPVESLGIVAKSYADNFSIDYTYET